MAEKKLEIVYPQDIDTLRFDKTLDEEHYTIDDNGNKNGPFDRTLEGKLFSCQGNYKDNKREGHFTLFYKSKLLAEGSYKNDMPDGEWKVYHENGKLKAEGVWKDNHEEGFWRYYYPNGNMEAEKEFENGHLKQLATFNEDGVVKHLTSYNLTTTGEVLTEHNFFYDENGKCLYSESDRKDFNRKTREIKEKVKYTEKYFPPKGTFVDEIEVKFADGIDVRWKFYKTGELREKMVIDLVSKNPCYTKKYYQNGQLAAEGEWEPSIPPKKLDGWKYYDENGNPTEPPKEKKPCG